MADNALPCEALRCPFVFGSGYDDFRKDLANRQQVHAPVGSFLGGFSKSASPNRTVELSGRFELPACTLRVCRSALQILEPYRYFSVNSGKRFSMGYVCKTAAYLPAAVQQSRLYGCVASGCAPALRGCSYVCMLDGAGFVVSEP